MSKTKSDKVWKNLVAGGTAGAVEVSIMYPTEFVKTQLQLAAQSQVKGQPPKYKGPIDCARSVVAEKGVIGLYRGLPTLIVGSIPKAAIRFAAFSRISKVFESKDGKLSTPATLVSGMLAGASEALCAVIPMETIKTKMIHDQSLPKPKYKGTIDGIQQIIKLEGIGGIYQGVAPTVAKQATNQMTRFLVFGRIKRLFQGDDTSVDLKLWQALASGAMAGFVSVYVTMPLDVVKTKMQGLQASNYTSSLDCLSKTYQKDGLLGLWKGTTPRLSRVMFSGAITFAAYEQILILLNTISP